MTYPNQIKPYFSDMLVTRNEQWYSMYESEGPVRGLLHVNFKGGVMEVRLSRKEIEAIAVRVAEEIGESEGVEIVEIQYVKEQGDYYLRVFIDKPGGVGLDDCQSFSQAFSVQFDELDPIPGSYSLEISSPGIERPLTRAEHYTRFSGRQVAIRTYAPHAGRKRWTGVLKGLNKDVVVLDVEGETIEIPLALIGSARLVANFEGSLRQGAKKK